MEIKYKQIKSRMNGVSRKGGLTLVELMVVIAIFMIITAVAMFNYSNFNSTVSLQNLTDDIALSIRKAQSFAIGARAVGDNFTNSYGMHFSANPNLVNATSGSDKSFLMFTLSSLDDKEYKNIGNNGFCGTPSGDCVELFNIESLDKVEKIIAYNGDSVELPNSDTSSIDIIFTRPDPKAVFCYREADLSPCQPFISRVDITISNGRDEEKKRMKTISVQNTGQISISNYENKQ